MTLIFPISSFIISSPIVVDTIFTVHLPINPQSICAHWIIYFPTKKTKKIHASIIKTFITPANHENGLCEV
jgi:hypothetical protein